MLDVDTALAMVKRFHVKQFHILRGRYLRGLSYSFRQLNEAKHIFGNYYRSPLDATELDCFNLPLMA